MKIKKSLKICIQIIFWALTYYFFSNYSFLRLPSFNKIEEYISLTQIIIIIYINYVFLIPSLFNEKKWILYFSSIIFSIIIISTFEFIYLKNDIIRITFNLNEKQQNGALIWNYFFILFRNILFVAFFTMFKIYLDAIKSKNLMEKVFQLEKLKMQTEINMIKSKVNSHFFFNTLNSIYAMALTESKETPEMITNLSELMRYVVADSENEWVSLDKEIEFINNYIALETIRHQKLDIQFELEGDTENIKVPPMIFESFVNNAFKYTDNEGRGYIYIKLECLTNDKLIFNCENNTRSTTDKSIQSSGKGLRNTRERLELHYNNNHLLDTNLTDGIYKVRLELNRVKTN